MHSRRLAALAPLALVCACGTIDSSSAPATAALEPALLNDSCPIMGGKVDPRLTVDHAGGKVGFCCAGCENEWNALSDAEKAARLAE